MRYFKRNFHARSTGILREFVRMESFFSSCLIVKKYIIFKETHRKRIAAVAIKSVLNLAIESSLKYKTKEKIIRRLNVFIAITVFKNSFIKITENQINTW